MFDKHLVFILIAFLEIGRVLADGLLYHMKIVTLKSGAMVKIFF